MNRKDFSIKIAAADTRKTREWDYWLRKLSADGDLVKSHFPYDFDYKKDNSDISSNEFKKVNFKLSERQFSLVMKLAGDSNVKLYILLVSILTLLLDKYMYTHSHPGDSERDIIIGTPISRQEDEKNLINTVLPIRNRFNDGMPVKELLMQVRETIIEAAEHQNYPVESLPDQLGLANSGPGFPLFDIILLLENIHDRRYIEHIPVNVIFSFCRTSEAVEGLVEYNSRVYRQETMEQVVNRFKRLVENGLDGLDKPLRGVEMVSEEEKARVLVEFNKTASPYPADKTLHRLFAGQMEKTPDHIAVIGRVHVTYKELNEKSNRLAHYLIYEKSVQGDDRVGILMESSLDLAVAILGILKAGAAYLPIDPSLPGERMKTIIRDASVGVVLSQKKYLRILNRLQWECDSFHSYLCMDIRDIYEEEEEEKNGVDVHCRVRPENLAYVIYTSGSTGKPKGVMVDHRSVVNTLFYRKEAYRMDASVRALQLFSYAFDGFVTAFFTPLLSGGAVILPGGEEGKDILKIKEAIFTDSVGHFISVPALFRVLMESLTPEEASSLKVVSLAGDKLTPDLLDLAGKKNKELEIVNEYGVTEAAVMSTLYRHQERDNNIKIGFPIGNTRIYILDSGNRPQPVGIYGELCIAGVGVARGYLNNPELTAKKFKIAHELHELTRIKVTINEKLLRGVQGGGFLEKSPPGRRRLYKTGDLARWLGDGAIEFAGRIDAQVKIRGFRIETGEIESLLRSHEDVSEALVTVVETGVGESSLCAYIVPYAGYSPDTADLKEYLSRQLPDYMIPVYFVFIEKMPLSASGKVDRRALPKPETARRQKGTVPRDEVEKKLAEIWCQVLGIEESQGVVGIDDNFFELGGHSLRATELIARIHKEMNVEVPLGEVFKGPFIRDLAQYIREASQTRYSPIEPVEKREYYSLTPAQERFYMMQQMDPGTTAYNMPQVIPLGPGVDKDRIAAAVELLIQRHESLRTAFLLVDDEPVQVVYDHVEFETEFFELAAKNAKGREEEENITRYFVRPFDLSQSPLLRVRLVETPEGDSILLVDMHHIVSDGTSQMVLTSDFVSLFRGEALGPIRLQYRDFSQWQNRMLRSEKGCMKLDEAFWLEHLAGKLPVLDMPMDFPRPRDRNYAGETFIWSLGRELSSGVYRLLRQTDTTLYMVLLTALNILLFRYTGQKDILIGSLAAGRTHADLEKIIGLVMGGFMIRNFPSAEKTFRDFLQEIKERTLAVFEHQAYPFEELLKKLDYEEIPERHPISDIALIVQNMLPGGVTEQQGDIAVDEMLPGVSKLELTLNVVEQGADILFVVEYRTTLFRRRTMERLLGHLANILKAAAAYPGIRCGEIDVLAGDEKRELIGTAVPFFPITHPQKRIYYTEKRYPRTTACLVTFTARYHRLLDKEIWEEAVNRVLQKNEGLRVRLVECGLFNEPFQYIAPYTRYTPDEVDVCSSAALAGWLDQKSREPFDLIDDDLFYFAYFKIDEQESGYYMKLHHFASDAGGALCLFNEIDRIYEALESGIPADEEANPSYLQYISEENRYLDSPQLLEDKTFWHRYLLPLPEPIHLSSGKTGNTNMSMAIEARARLIAIPNDLRTRIHRYCKKNKTSIFKVMLSALSVYISRATGSDDFVIGSVNHNRPTKSHWRTTGMFASTIPFRIKINSRISFGEWVNRIGKEINTIVKNHQEYPFDRLIDELREKTGIDPGYLLNVNLIDLPDVTEGKFEIERNFFGAEPAPLTIHININSRDIQGILELEWDYQVRYFSPGDIERMHRSLVNILTDALAHPSRALWQIDWLDTEEKEQVIELFNRSGTVEAETFYTGKPLHRLFEEQAERKPDSVAVVGKGHGCMDAWMHGNISITFRELSEKSSKLAYLLKERGVLADDIIAIMVERSVGMIIGILGILKTGAAYLPIDPDYPQERIDYMLKDSNAGFLLTARETLDVFKGTACCAPTISPATCNLHLSLAYIIYTSGSTGRPKGVMVTHQNVVNYLNAFDWQFDLQPSDIVVQQASYAFDAFVEEMYPILLKGGVLAIPSKEEVTDIQRLMDFVVRHQVTMITCSPLMLGQMNQHPAIYGTAVRIFISGGDRLKFEHIDNFLKIGSAKVYNTYGPTETTVCATYYQIGESDEADIPIGKPIPGYKVYILDAYFQPVPVGVNGELCITGAGVAEGYLNNPELTREKFQIPNYKQDVPFAQIYAFGENINAKCPMTNDRLYRTGDLARWLADGNIEFTGRIDKQVNIRGYRVEPGEIENRLIKLETIKDALVVAKEDNGGDLYLCAYVIPDDDQQVNVSELRDYLLAQLPVYMVPGFFVPVKSIPLTPNGKPDLKALPDPLSKPVDDYEPPADRLEEELVTLWSEVLIIPREHIGVTVNFFDIGGQSIKATKLASKIHKHFNVKVPLAEIFNRPHVRELASYIKEAGEDTFIAMEKAEKKEYYALSSAQKRLYIVQQMEPTGIAYNVPVVVNLDQEIDRQRLQWVFRTLVERHESFRTSFIEVEGEPVQRVNDVDEVTFEIEYYEKAVNGHWSLVNGDADPSHSPYSPHSLEDIARDFVRPFALSAVPLLRVGLLKREEERYTLLLDSHHIISDGASREILVREFMILYSVGQLPPLKLQYTDFSEWQNKLFASGEIKKQEEYWLNRFKGDIPVLNLPTDFPRETASGESGSRLRFALERDLAKRIKRISKETDTTLFMVFLAVYTLLLSKYSRQDDIIVGTGTTGRNHADLENIIGMFVNTLPLRNRIPVSGSFKEFLNTAKKNVLEIYENEDFQYEELVNRLGVERTSGRNPLFDCTFTFQKEEDKPDNVSGLSPAAPQMPANTYEHPAAKFDLLLKVIEKGDNMDLMLEYKTTLFKESTIREFKDHLIEILEQAVGDIDIQSEDIKISHRLLVAQSTILQEEDDEFGF